MDPLFSPELPQSGIRLVEEFCRVSAKCLELPEERDVAPTFSSGLEEKRECSKNDFDDGSRDRTAEIAMQFSEFRLIRQPNKGLSVAPGAPAATRITKSTNLSVVEVSPSRRRASLTK